MHKRTGVGLESSPIEHSDDRSACGIRWCVSFPRHLGHSRRAIYRPSPRWWMAEHRAQRFAERRVPFISPAPRGQALIIRKHHWQKRREFLAGLGTVGLGL